MSFKPLQTIAVLLLGLVILGGTGCSKVKKSRALDRAEKYFKAGEYEKARIEFLNVLSLDPQNFKAHSSLGKIYFERGQIVAGIPFLKMARKIETNDLEIALDLGMSYLGIMDRPKARAEADFILAKKPDHADALLLLADTAATPEEVTTAMQRLDELQKQVGEKAGIYLAKANLFLKQRDVSSAQKAVEKAEQLDPKSPVALTAMGSIRWSKNELEEADRLFVQAAELLPIRSSHRLRRVDLKFQTGKIEEAKKILKEITDKAPDQVPALVYQAKIAFAEKQYAESLQLCQKVLGLDRVNYDAMLMIGRCKLAEKKYADALKDFDRAKGLYGRSPEIFYYAALAHIGNQEIDKGIVSLTQAISFDANYTPATLLLAEWNIRKGNAVSAIQLLTPVIEKQPKMVQPYLLLATAYRAQDRLNEVVQVYEKLIRILPDDPEPRFLLGWTLRQLGKKAEARQQFLKAHEMNPKRLQAFDQLIDMDLADKAYDTAWKRLEPETAANPKSPDLQYLIARVHLAQKNTDKAEEALNKALEFDPNYRLAYLALAEMFTSLQKPEVALEKLKAGLEKNPRDTVSLMKAGMLYEQLKDFEGAAKMYEQTLTVNQNFVPALNNLAYLYSERLPQLDKAYTLAQKAREKAPNDPFCADTYGWVLFHRGEYAMALKLIQECADRFPNHPEVLYHLGMAHYMTGNEAAAKADLTKALANKDLPARETAESCLAVLKVDISKPDAIAQLENAVEKRPKDFVALLRLAAAHEHAGDYDKSRLNYEKALQVNSKSVPAIVDLARLYATRLQNPTKALELAKNARNLAPDDPEVVGMLGPLAYDAGDYPWALTMLQKNNQLHPDHPETLYYLGLCYFGLGRVSEAENMASEALTKSNFSNVQGAKDFLSLVSFYKAPEKTDTAKVNDVLKKDPNYPPALLVYGLVQEKQQKYPEARQAYEKILSRNGQFVLATKHLGILLAEHFKEDPKAIELLAKARESLTQDVNVARSLGILARKKNDNTWAAQLLKEAAREMPSDSAVLYNLGIAQYNLKQKAEGKENLRRALELDQNNPLATDAKRILSEK